MLNSAFDEVRRPFDRSLPARVALRNRPDQRFYVYDAVNDGVYRYGFAKTQTAYETSFRKLFAALDQLEERLGQHRYLVGDQLYRDGFAVIPG